jgi:acetyltransferase-like isoleucine patch superfamily enzyme
MSVLPPTRCWALKRTLLRWAGAEIGECARVVSSVRIHTTGSLFIGRDAYIGHEVMIAGGDAAIRIGASAAIGPRTLIVTGSHDLGDETAAGPGRSDPINIGDGVWIGAGSTVLGGVTIGSMCLIGAGALVRENLPEHVLAAGVPARVVRRLGNT